MASKTELRQCKNNQKNPINIVQIMTSFCTMITQINKFYSFFIILSRTSIEKEPAEVRQALKIVGAITSLQSKR